MRPAKYLSLTKEEIQAVKRRAEKLLEHKGRVSNREQRRKDNEVKLLKGLISRLDEAAEVQSKLNRNDLRAIQGLCNVSKKALEEMIIPGYKTRISEAADDVTKERYQKYVNDAELTLQREIAILGKVEVCL